MRLSNQVRLLFTIGLVVGSALLYGCGSSGSGSGSKVTSKNGPELHATVLDKEINATPPTTNAVNINLAGRTVSFKKGEPLRIAFDGYGKGFDYSVPEYAGAGDVATQMHLAVTQFDPQGDPQTQINQVQSILNSGRYNALVVYPLATGLECNLLTKQAPEKGVVVVTIGYPACNNENATPGLLTAIPDTPSPAVFTAWGNEIVKLQGSPAKQKALIVTGPKLDLNSEWAVSALKRIFGKVGTKLEEVVDTDYTEPGSLPKIQDALQGFPGTTEIDVMFPEGTAAALTALKTIGKSGKIGLYGYGANQPSVLGLESGALKMSIPFYPYTNVRAAYQALQLARDGKSVPPFIPYAGHAVESMRAPGAPFLFVEPNNVKAYAAKDQEY